MLTVHQVSKSYGINTILKGVSFSISAGERVGLIGPNGCGKTTLLHILAGIEEPDQGVVTSTTPELHLGYLSQGFELDSNQTLDTLLERAKGEPGEIQAELERLAMGLAKNPDDAELQNAYDGALLRLNLLAYKEPPDRIFHALGLRDISGDQLIGTLSGGQKTRLALALVLLGDPNLLLLDEPTNHLDIQMLEWLEEWLSSFSGAALIVSHDRTFLDQTVTRIIDLDPETHTTREYQGNYTAYLEQYLKEREKQWATYRDQVEEIRRMKQDIARTKQQSVRVEQTTTSREPGVRRIAKKVAKKALSREKKLERYVESDERVEKPKMGWQMKLKFDTPQHLGQDVLAMEDLVVGYAGYDPLIRDVNLYIRAGERIVLTGPNGEGKTTLLRTIAGQIPAISGKVRMGSSVRLGYMTQEQELLDPESTALEIIQHVAPLNETEVRSFLHYFLFSGDDPLRSVSKLSYGERARLSLATLVAQGSNFLLLDEPINHLDIPSRIRFEQALSLFEGTVIAVVHDRYFIERFATEIWVLENHSITRIT